MIGKRKRIVGTTTVRVYSTEDKRIGKVASQLFEEEQKFYAEQRYKARNKSWDRLVELVREQCPESVQQEVINMS